LNEFEKALEREPKIAAFGYASNATGTINPVRKLTAMARDAGALTYIDAVQYAPHGPIDVQSIGCDFLVCSAYKFFGPHVGILYGKLDLLESLKAYKVRPAPDDSPGKWMTGTQNHEGIAGVLGALEYFEWLAENFASDQKQTLVQDGLTGRRLNLEAAMTAIRAYEFELSRRLIEVIQTIPGTHIHGITDMKRLDQRVPTVSFTLEGKHPREIAEKLGQEGFYVWDGNYYALAVTERLGLEASGGMVRVGPVHYNTLDEISRFGEALAKISPA
jgi:selenocysteine lyase/cysteine desulfurase